MATFYITTPLYYVNSKPHIGHSYTQIACDTVARYLRQSGFDVFFMTGTDEHGEKIEEAAVKAGFKAGDEKRFVDTIVPQFIELWKKLGIRYDRFIRTTDAVHEATVKKVLTLLFENGKITKKIYEGWFCTPCETFWTATQAPDGICPDCRRALEKLKEENYFLKMSEYQGALVEHIRKGPLCILPEIRRNEVLSFLEKNELADLCISRPKSRLSWGIELPFDANFVTYVWFDALINYISGIGYLDDRARFDSLWPSVCHFIGKDILRHHAIYWPIMLMGLGERPPRRIFAHGWWVVGGEKMSKSKGNVVDPMAMIEKYGVEPFRYYLLRAVQFGQDGTFSEDLFVEKYNADLANDLGNLLNRTLAMVEKYVQGVIPARGEKVQDDRLKECALGIPGRMSVAFGDWDFSLALKVLWELVNAANKYIEEKAPWKLSKAGDAATLGGVMYDLVQSIGLTAVCLYPFMPATAQAIWEQLGMKTNLEDLRFRPGERGVAAWSVVPAGTKIKKGAPLFPRIEVEQSEGIQNPKSKKQNENRKHAGS